MYDSALGPAIQPSIGLNCSYPVTGPARGGKRGVPRLPIRPSAVLNTLYRTGSAHCLCRHHQDMVAIASECQHWAYSNATRPESASYNYLPSTCASAASASRSQHVIAMAREVLRGWGAYPGEWPPLCQAASARADGEAVS